MKMSNLLEITGEDISALNDADLRSLVGLLCEADYRAAQLSCKGITWGGHQDAADGGLDVVVRGEAEPPGESYIPRAWTGFQVKKPKMGPTDIEREMRPDGALRPSIKTLIESRGSYIIVSSGADCATETALNDRIAAMKSAVANEDGDGQLAVDFLDRGRIATWVRAHPSLILKVRQQIGRPLTGWQSYENWSKAPGGTDEEYLLDDGLRLHDKTSSSATDLSVQDGLKRLRSSLSAPGSCLRLAGLSGVGKTRLAQALFDDRVGEGSLNPFLVYYTDMSDSPNPDPCVFAEQLIAARTQAVLVVDNCPPELHNRLVRQCAAANSTVSLLTVEYDVRDDLPDETQVFGLEPASEQLIEKLVSRRYPHVTQVDARTIAEFSGGNARLAVALANTVAKGETLSGFRDDELFGRLFWQRNERNDDLLMSAELCSLVYSFEGTDTQGEESELKFLASLRKKTAADLYRDVRILQDRGLAQSRHVWRAVLPHAVANRLARRALETIPKDALLDSFLCNSSERLIKSFARRLGYLHDCLPAVEIVEDLLSPQGWLGSDLVNLNAFGMDVLTNIAPVSPKAALDSIERAASTSTDGSFLSTRNRNADKFVQLLRHLAYEPDLFSRSADLMSRFALSEDEHNKTNSRDALISLFHAYLSGTRASPDDRAAFIERFASDGEPARAELGLRMLDASLEAWHFSSSNEFDFGARKRDFGYQPESIEEVEQWYKTFLSICVRLCVSGTPIADGARKTLANNLRGLWRNTGIFDYLEKAVRKVHADRPWIEGWLALRGIIRFDSKGLPDDVRNRLHALESDLRPDELLDQVRTFALTDHHSPFDLSYDHDDEPNGASSALSKLYDTTRELGKKVAGNFKVLELLLPELVSAQTQRLGVFGEGLAAGCDDRSEIWRKLRFALEMTAPEKRQIAVLCGFLAESSRLASSFCDSTLDDLVDDEMLGPWFPYFQTSVSLDDRAVKRLHRALDCGRAPIHTFQHIAYGRVHELVSDSDLATLIDKILCAEGGTTVAAEILKMRFHGKEGAPSRGSEALKAVGRKTLAAFSYPREGRRGNNEYDLARLVEVCLGGPEGEDCARIISRNLATAIETGAVYAFDYSELLVSLASSQSTVFLDMFLGSRTENDNRRRRLFMIDLNRHGNPLNAIPDESLIRWCDAAPDRRYPLVAGAIVPFSEQGESNVPVWKPIVHILFERAPVLNAVLRELGDCVRPRGGWSGSLADILERRNVLFACLFAHDNDEIAAWARNRHSAVREWIARERENEARRSSHVFESFE